MTRERGRFISIEGIEGAGKTTQVNRLWVALGNAGIEAETTREPGGTPGAELIRRLFIDRGWDGIAESFLLMASRRDHVRGLVEPTLASGRWVVCDRFALTTFAYQGYGRGIPMDLLAQMNLLATSGLRPDLSIVLDVPPDIGLARARKRAAPDRMERLGVAWFERVREGFMDLASKDERKCAVINATYSSDKVHEAVKSMVCERLGVKL